jgi:hypothetical protein
MCHEGAGPLHAAGVWYDEGVVSLLAVESSPGLLDVDKASKSSKRYDAGSSRETPKRYPPKGRCRVGEWRAADCNFQIGGRCNCLGDTQHFKTLEYCGKLWACSGCGPTFDV